MGIPEYAFINMLKDSMLGMAHVKLAGGSMLVD